MPTLVNSSDRDLSLLLADEYEWERFVAENPWLDGLFPVAPGDDYDLFLDTIAANDVSYPAEWDDYRAGYFGEPEDYYRKHGLSASPTQTPAVPAAVGYPETPHASTEAALTHLRGVLLDHYRATETALASLKEPCVVGSFRLEVPSFIMGAFAVFTQGMLVGEAEARFNLTRVLEAYADLPPDDEKTQAVVSAYAGLCNGIYEKALGRGYNRGENFSLLLAEYKTAGNATAATASPLPFEDIRPHVFGFLLEFLEAHPEAYDALQGIGNSSAWEATETAITARERRLQESAETIAACDKPQELYDLIHNFDNYGPAKMTLYRELGLWPEGKGLVDGLARIESWIASAGEAVAKAHHFERDPYDPKGRILVADPVTPPRGMSSATWELLVTLAKRKRELETKETAFTVFYAGASIAAAVGAGILSGGNPVIAGLAGAATAVAFGTADVARSANELSFGRAAYDVSVFEGVLLGSAESVALLNDNLSYAVGSAVFNTLLAGLGGGGSAVLASTKAISGSTLRSLGFQALYGALDGGLSQTADGRIYTQGEKAGLAGSDPDSASSPAGLIFTASLIGGAFGLGTEAAFRGGRTLLAHLDLGTKKVKFYAPDGTEIPVKRTRKIGDGVYEVVAPDGGRATVRFDADSVGVILERSGARRKSDGTFEIAPDTDPRAMAARLSEEGMNLEGITAREGDPYLKVKAGKTSVEVKLYASDTKRMTTSPAAADASVPVTARAHDAPGYYRTREAVTHLIEVMASGGGFSRAEIKARTLALLDATNLHLSSDDGKAVDALITLTQAAGETFLDRKGGLSSKQLADLLTMQIVKDAPGVRMAGTELIHVPQVALNSLDSIAAECRLAGVTPTVADYKIVFIQAFFHDAGKFNPAIRTTYGYVMHASSRHNPYGADIRVAPGETLAEAIRRQGFDPARMNEKPFVAGRYLAPVMTHQDALDVRTAMNELAEAGVITPAEADVILSAILLHAIHSSWVRNNSMDTEDSAGIGSNFMLDMMPERYRKFSLLYQSLTDRMAIGQGLDELALDPVYGPMVAELRAEACEVFTPAQKALLFGDHLGQIDIPKYLSILTLSPPAGDLTVHGLVFGRASGYPPRYVPGWRSGSIEGVLLTHRDQLRLIDPDLGQDAATAFNHALNWMNAPEGMPGLSQAVIANPELYAAYQAWAQARPEGSPGSVLAWLDTIPVFVAGKKNPVYEAISSQIDPAFFAFIASEPATGAASRTTMTGGLDLARGGSHDDRPPLFRFETPDPMQVVPGERSNEDTLEPTEWAVRTFFDHSPPQNASSRSALGSIAPGDHTAAIPASNAAERIPAGTHAPEPARENTAEMPAVAASRVLPASDPRITTYHDIAEAEQNMTALTRETGREYTLFAGDMADGRPVYTVATRGSRNTASSDALDGDWAEAAPHREFFGRPVLHTHPAPESPLPSHDDVAGLIAAALLDGVEQSRTIRWVGEDRTYTTTLTVHLTGDRPEVAVKSDLPGPLQTSLNARIRSRLDEVLAGSSDRAYLERLASGVLRAPEGDEFESGLDTLVQEALDAARSEMVAEADLQAVTRNDALTPTEMFDALFNLIARAQAETDRAIASQLAVLKRRSANPVATETILHDPGRSQWAKLQALVDLEVLQNEYLRLARAEWPENVAERAFDEFYAVYHRTDLPPAERLLLLQEAELRLTLISRGVTPAEISDQVDQSLPAAGRIKGLREIPPPVNTIMDPDGLVGAFLAWGHGYEDKLVLNRLERLRVQPFGKAWGGNVKTVVAAGGNTYVVVRVTDNFRIVLQRNGTPSSFKIVYVGDHTGYNGLTK